MSTHSYGGCVPGGEFARQSGRCAGRRIEGCSWTATSPSCSTAEYGINGLVPGYSRRSGRQMTLRTTRRPLAREPVVAPGGRPRLQGMHSNIQLRLHEQQRGIGISGWKSGSRLPFGTTPTWIEVNGARAHVATNQGGTCPLFALSLRAACTHAPIAPSCVRVRACSAVSYTHLTLPTILLV